jgi:hypothetical protein
MFLRTFIENRNAVLGQPFRLVVVLCIASAIIFLFSLILQAFLSDTQFQEIDKEIDTILLESASMYEYANEGSRVTLHITFPATLRYIVFGSLPGPSSTEPVNRTLDENTSNNCYYVTNDGTIRSFHTNSRFSTYNMTEFCIFHSGSYKITLELRQNEGQTYVTFS